MMTHLGLMVQQSKPCSMSIQNVGQLRAWMQTPTIIDGINADFQ